jgi:hypothetical protein
VAVNAAAAAGHSGVVVLLLLWLWITSRLLAHPQEDYASRVDDC